jgi:subtilase family serine protease
VVPVVLVPLVAVVAADADAAPTAARVALRNSAPRWVARTATPSSTARTAPVDVRVFLAPKGGEQALDAAVAAVSTPGSPQYRHFLTPEQYRQRFAPTDAAVTSVRDWLATNGFTVTGVEGARRYVTAHGDASAASRAFAVSLRNYQRDGRIVQAPTTDATVPAAVAGLVAGVTGLDNEPHTMKPAVAPAAPPPIGLVNARPCSQYFGQIAARYQADYKTPLPAYRGKTLPYAVCGYTPSQLRAAYGVTTTPLTGKGATIGVIDAYAAPTIAADANTYSSRHGDQPFASGQFSQSNAARFTNQSLCDPSGWYGEETLDVEAAHGIAPAAKLRYYGAASCLDSDLYGAVARTLDENEVGVVSNSYGEADSDAAAGDLAVGNQLYKQAAMQGITYLFSSGDDADEVAASGMRQSDSPASDPNVTAVGGTSTAIAADGTTMWQTGWGTGTAALSTNGKSWSAPSYLYGGGGGDSTLFPKPGYQNGVVPPSEGGGRAVPDVAMNADPNTGMLIGETQTFGKTVAYGEYRLGGTSLASPLMAGMVALAGQRTGRLGFLNPAVYAATRSGKNQFNDVKAVHVGDGVVRPDYLNTETGTGPIHYSVRTFGQDASLSLGNGWDETTGVGTPNARFLTGFGG